MATKVSGRLLARYVEKSRDLGWILFFVAVIVIIIGYAVGGGPGLVIAAVGGALIPAAVVNAWFDPLLREQAAQDIYGLLQLKESLTRSGIQEVGLASAVGVTSVVVSATSIDCMPLFFREWKDRDFPEIIRACEQRPIRVRVYLSAPEDTWCGVLADRFRDDPEIVRRDLRALPDQLLEAWDTSRVHAEASIEVFFFNGAPSVGITRTDARTVIEFGAAVRNESVRRPSHVLVFDDTSSIGEWGHRQFGFYDDNNSPPSSAGLRPLLASTALTALPSDETGSPHA